MCAPTCGPAPAFSEPRRDSFIAAEQQVAKIRFGEVVVARERLVQVLDFATRAMRSLQDSRTDIAFGKTMEIISGLSAFSIWP